MAGGGIISQTSLLCAYSDLVLGKGEGFKSLTLVQTIEGTCGEGSWMDSISFVEQVQVILQGNTQMSYIQTSI